MPKREKLGERLIAEKCMQGTGLRGDLAKAFGKERGRKMLALPTYQMCERKASVYSEEWLKERGYGADLSSQRISDLFKGIRENEANAFFKSDL